MLMSQENRGEEELMDIDEAPHHVQNGGNGIIHRYLGDTDHISDDEEGGVRIGDIYIPPAPKPALTSDTIGPRLIITHIVNENFKSYAGQQTLGPFHKSFTAIIGPNGSGKSNVIDSMLFVFGYRATKIRSKKISVLIHSSSKYPNLNSACVAVHFCQIIDKGGDEYTVIPNSEIVVTRSAFKDNSSFYTLNGKRVQFKEVARMLRSYGIDLDHNRFLILQGEVEQIAMMKPKAQTEHESGMLEYLEDIIGTSRFKKPIEQLSVKVEEFSDLRKEKLNRVRVVEKEKQKLEKPMREAVQQMNLTNAVLRNRNLLLHKYIYETDKVKESKEKEMEELKSNLATITETLDKVSEELKEKTAAFKAGSQKYEFLQKKKEEISEKLRSCNKKIVTTQADTTQATKKKKNLEQLIQKEKGKLIEMELVPEKNTREIEDCEKLLAKHEVIKKSAVEELQTLMVGVRSKTQGLQEQKDKLQSKLMDLKKIEDEENNQYRLAESELKIYLSTETTETEKLEKMREAYEKAVTGLKEKQAQQYNLESTLPSKEKELREVHAKLQSLKEEESCVSIEAISLRAKLQESQQAMSANRSRGKVLDALMDEKKNGNLPGVFGRLGDLGGIDPKYDVAISTCCGALDNIVVDTVETAQGCVEHLKRRDIGRATFIALDKQQHLISQYSSRHTYPENAPRLFDLVKVKDERVLPAFYYALRDTLVANDLDQASRIAYGATRYRVVTLQGGVIEIAGTMSGGGKTTLRGRMSRSAQDTRDQDPAAIRASEKRLVSLEKRLAELHSEQVNLHDLFTSLQRYTRDGKTTLHKLHVELRSLVEQLPVLETQIQQQEARVAVSKVDAKQKAKLEAVLEVAVKKLEEAKHNAGEVEKEVQGIDAQISAAAGGKVKDLQKNVDDLTKKINKVFTEITKLRLAINTSKKNAKNSKEKINQMEADLKDTVNKLENLSNLKKQLTIESSEYQKEIENIEEQLAEDTNQFFDVRQNINELQSKENKLKSELLEAKNAVVKIEKTIEDCMIKTPVWKKELSTLILEDCDIEGVPGIKRPEPLITPTPEQLEKVKLNELRNKLQSQKTKLGDAKPNIQAIQDYKDVQELYLRRAAELDEITGKRNEIRELYDQLKKKRTTDFLSGFNSISGKLREMYQTITLGGDAELELVDSLDPFSEGVIFSVRPPSKSWKNISNLSGGEKTLSSLALVFALHYYKPTPLYVMDEIDAALDFKNVSIVANYIKERTKNAQFIIISLRYNMFEVAHRLVGIYKTDDCTKSVTIENKEPEPEIQMAIDEIDDFLEF